MAVLFAAAGSAQAQQYCGGQVCFQMVLTSYTGGAGPDVVCGTPGADTINGGGGADLLCGRDGNDIINGGDNADGLYGEAGNDTIHGNNGTDTIRGGADHDSLYGDAGNDRLYGGTGNDLLDGGTDVDWADYSESATGITADLNTNTVTGEGTDTLASVRRIQGSPQGDTLRGSGLVDYLYGGAGNDQIEGRQQDDFLHGEAGSDVIYGDGGADTIQGNEDNDWIEGGPGNDNIHGGLGVNTISYHNAPSGVNVNLTASPAAVSGGDGSDTVAFVQNIEGSAYADGLATNGWMWGREGDDIMAGASPASSSTATVDYLYSSDGVTIDLGTDPDTSWGTASSAAEGDDILLRVKNINGSFHADSITMNHGVNTVFGRGGDDYIHGRDGNDFLYGDGGTDTIDGGAGNADTCVGEILSDCP